MRSGKTELGELRHRVGNALGVASGRVRFRWDRLPALADTRDCQALAGIQGRLLRAGRLLGRASPSLPATRCDLRALVTLATSRLPPERLPDLLLRERSETSLISHGQPERIVELLAN